MIWAPKWVKGAAVEGFARASDRRLAASVAALAEDIAGMVLLWGENVMFWRCALPVSTVCKCGSIGSGVGPCRCTSLPFYGSPMCAAVTESRG